MEIPAIPTLYAQTDCIVDSLCRAYRGETDSHQWSLCEACPESHRSCAYLAHREPNLSRSEIGSRYVYVSCWPGLETIIC